MMRAVWIHVEDGSEDDDGEERWRRRDAEEEMEKEKMEEEEEEEGEEGEGEGEEENGRRGTRRRRRRRRRRRKISKVIDLVVYVDAKDVDFYHQRPLPLLLLNKNNSFSCVLPTFGFLQDITEEKGVKRCNRSKRGQSSDETRRYRQDADRSWSRNLVIEDNCRQIPDGKDTRREEKDRMQKNQDEIKMAERLTLPSPVWSPFSA
jgi:hypothetical protein